MPKKRKVGNLLGLAVLSYLTAKPMHPYELSRTLRDNDDDRSIKFNHGSLYMVVKQLTNAGFIEPQDTSREGQRPERTTYRLTEAGRAEFLDWMRELVAEPADEYPHFGAALSFISALPPTEVVSLLQARLAGLADSCAEARERIDSAAASGVPSLFLVEEEYRIAIWQAEAAFVQRFIDRACDPANEWGRNWAAFHETTAHETTVHGVTAQGDRNDT